MKYIFFLGLPLYLLDQFTKYWVIHHVEPSEPRPVLPDHYFDLVNVTNNGAAFGSFKGHNGFFIGLSCLVLLFVVSLLVRHRQRDVLRDISLGLFLAGILGNLTDRLVREHVIDFILVNLRFWPANPWPAFNVADSCICLAVIFYLIHSFLAQKNAGAASPG